MIMKYIKINKWIQILNKIFINLLNLFIKRFKTIINKISLSLLIIIFIINQYNNAIKYKTNKIKIIK